MRQPYTHLRVAASQTTNGALSPYKIGFADGRRGHGIARYKPHGKTNRLGDLGGQRIVDSGQRQSAELLEHLMDAAGHPTLDGGPIGSVFATPKRLRFSRRPARRESTTDLDFVKSRRSTGV